MDERKTAFRSELIAAAQGKIPVDLLVKNGTLVNVLSASMMPGTHIAVHKGYVVGFGRYEASSVVDVKGSFVAPGFFDGHCHLESSMVSPSEFARAVIPRGVTAVVTDPHEIANVCGKAGIRFMLDAGEDLPLDIYVMLPSCVPSSTFETSGAVLLAGDLREFMEHKRVLGLGELMNVPGTLSADPLIMEKLALAVGRLVDGHAPGLSGKELSAYIIAGPSSDHECVTMEEAGEKLEKGMTVMLREGTYAKNLESLLPLVTPLNYRQFVLVTDDIDPLDIREQGHIDHLVRKVISLGVDPLIAFSMATLNAARHFHLPSHGAIAPGYQADMVVIDDLWHARKVFKKGVLVAEDGLPLFSAPPLDLSPVRRTVSALPFDEALFRVPARSLRIHCIGIVPHEIVTEDLVIDAKVNDGHIVADPGNDIAKIAVIERHHATGGMAVGFIKGLGLRKGACASTIAHDSHNIIVAGMNDHDMKRAVDTVIGYEGGIAIVEGGLVKAALPLPLGGLMSDGSFADVAEKKAALNRAAVECGMEKNQPFMILSFMALPVIPALRITDKGLVDEKALRYQGLFDEVPVP
ncbi:MAG: adenine deaminase [Candidatus Eremiobacteraeota bacterium]|nr:adenine deaminase [Candidatus Eremiobacteraeota bacterium]